MKGQKAAKAAHEITRRQQRKAIRRHLKRFVTGALSAEDRHHANRDREVPNESAQKDDARTGQAGAAQLTQQPQAGAQRGGHGEAVEQRGVLRGVKPPVGPVRLAGEKTWSVKLERD